MRKRESYLGNDKLKPIGSQVNFSHEQVEELLKCSNDAKYFMETYGNIVTIDGGLSKVNLYPYQKKIIDIVEDNRFFIGKLPRQSGKCVTGNTKIKVRRKNEPETECEMMIETFHNTLKEERNARETSSA